MKMSENLDKLFEALALAQGKIKGALKDSSNPFFKSKYTSLDSCWDACRGPLSEHGLSVVQLIGEDNGKPTFTTILGHSSGQFISSTVSLAIKSQDPQGISSATTYFRRFTLCAMVGITSGDDDDGEKEMESHRKQSQVPLITQFECDTIRMLLVDLDEYKASLLSYLQISDFSQLPANRYDKILEAIYKHRESKGMK